MDLINRRLQGKIPPLKRKPICKKHWLLSYEQLKKTHIRDYQSLFNRVELNLGTDQQAATLPTDERLKKYASAPSDLTIAGFVLPVWAVPDDRQFKAWFTTYQFAGNLE